MDEGWETWTRRELCDLRACHGSSRAEFARRVGVDLRTVQRWEAGETRPAEKTVIARLHNLARQIIAKKASWLFDSQGMLLMNRRDALRMLAGGAVVSVPGVPSVLPRRVSDTQLDGIEATTTALAGAYHRVAPQTLLAPVTAHLEEASRLLQVSMASRQHDRLLSATGDLAAFVARLAFVCDRPGQMEAYLELAQSRAYEAGDHVLLAQICCARANLYSDSPNGSPYHDPKTAGELLEQATNLAVDAPGWVRSHVAAALAEERAAGEDAGGSDEAYDAALLALHDTSGPPMPASGFFSTSGFYAHWGESGQIEGYQGVCAVLLGRSERAGRILQARLDRPLTPRKRATSLADLGAALAQGDPDEAAVTLIEAHELNVASGNTLGYRRILGACEKLKGVDTPKVRELFERLHLPPQV
ncbi:MAG: helix-turn-helix domain-containing protein [Egibacteraceae bacterium]